MSASKVPETVAPIRWFFITLSTLSVLALCACGASSTKGGFDAKRANSLSHAALLNPADLGPGWKVAEDDKFTVASDVSLASTSECDEFRSILASSEKGIAGKAERQFELPGASPTTITFEVDIYETSKGLADLLMRYRKFIGKDGLLTCQLDTIKTVPGRQPIGTPLKASFDAPANGVSLAYNLNVGQAPNRVDIKREQYVWVDGNATMLLMFTGPKSDVSADLIKPILDQARAAVERAKKAG